MQFPTLERIAFFTLALTLWTPPLFAEPAPPPELSTYLSKPLHVPQNEAAWDRYVELWIQGSQLNESYPGKADPAKLTSWMLEKAQLEVQQEEALGALVQLTTRTFEAKFSRIRQDVPGWLEWNNSIVAAQATIRANRSTRTELWGLLKAEGALGDFARSHVLRVNLDSNGQGLGILLDLSEWATELEPLLPELPPAGTFPGIAGE